ncbi:MAG: class I SAM-dependent methyltransferase [Magnetococcales bacterium]|nr:class I SAM-dependent methyltransferase [Magnetococcales bacterium]
MDPETYRNMAATQDVHWWFRGRRRVLEKMLERCSFPSDARILDAGCGTGPNLGMLQRFGGVWGMEPNDFALDVARKTAGAIVEFGTLPDRIPFASLEFHLITLLDVLSCCEDDGAVIESLSNRLVDGGWLLVTAPAYDFLWSSHDEAQHHYRRYTILRLRRLMEGAGLRVVFATHFNILLFFPIALVRLFKKMTGLLRGDDTGALPREWINRLLYRILALESGWIGRSRALPFGVSLLVMAQRGDRRSSGRDSDAPKA